MSCNPNGGCRDPKGVVPFLVVEPSKIIFFIKNAIPKRGIESKSTLGRLGSSNPVAPFKVKEPYSSTPSNLSVCKTRIMA